MLSVMGSTLTNCLVLLPFVSMFYCVDVKGTEKPTPLLYRGNTIPITAAPFMAVLKNSEYACAAAIIHHLMLLSAAHCNNRKSKRSHSEVIVGTDQFTSDFKPIGGLIAAVKRVQNHPRYRGYHGPSGSLQIDSGLRLAVVRKICAGYSWRIKMWNVNNLAVFCEELAGRDIMLLYYVNRYTWSLESDIKFDMCVIVLASTLTFSDKVKPIPLGFHYLNPELIPREAETMSFYGFSETLQRFIVEIRTLELQYVNKSKCQDVYMREDNAVLHDNIFCGRREEGKVGCQDVTGGLVVYKGHILGILSYISDVNCTEQQSVTYFTYVPSMRTFIERIMIEDWETVCAFKVRGGKSVSITEAPFVASFKVEDKRFTCAATIIHEQFLLSNAHCLQNTALMQAQLVINVGHESNEGGGKKYAVDKNFIHPKYNVNIYDFDLAVIKLRKKITWTDKIRKVDILGATDEGIQPDAKFPVLRTRDEPPQGTSLTVYGFAEDSEEGHARLNRLNLPSYNLRNCQNLYSSKSSYYISDFQICAGDEGYQEYCAGDSGSPLIYNGTLIGIASWGKASCQLGFPSIFTNVPLLYPFIDEIIQKNK